jgi:hydroxymethylpyrimidine/phosphomethylpyrimidine kinase
MLAIALTIAGSDPSGGAGVQADLKTFHQFGVYGTAAITLLTVQNTRRVSRVEMIDPALLVEQARAVLEDVPPNAAKTGALGAAQMIRAVASLDLPCPLVVDPVMISKHGASLMEADARESLVRELLPKAFLVTPNLHEAAAITGREVTDLDTMKRAADKIAALGARAVLIKGGHLEGDAVDLLLDAGAFEQFRSPRVHTAHTHGTGCTYSAAITALLARGENLRDAIAAAKRFIAEAIRTNPGIGGGSGPVNHFASPGVERE